MKFKWALKRKQLLTRESANGYLLVALKRCFDGVHVAYNNDGKIDPTEFEDILHQFCEALHKFYSYKTTAKVGISVKLFTGGEKEKWLRTIARNTDSKRRYASEFDTFKHTVEGNTAFRHVVGCLNTGRNAIRPKLYYLNLSIERDYREEKYHNSSIEFLRSTTDDATDYPLGYKSELVVPVIPPLDAEGRPGQESVVAGFLCIDIAEDQTTAFNIAYEHEMLLGVGHAIFLLGKLLNQSAGDNV